jgi:hypothetical protein
LDYAQWSCLWRILYRYLGEQKSLSIGTYPEVSLTEARGRREEARLCLRDGKDPIVERKKAAQAEQERKDAEDTFGKIANELVAKWRREGLAETTLIKKGWLLGMALPALEGLRVREIRPIDVLRVLQEVAHAPKICV